MGEGETVVEISAGAAWRDYLEMCKPRVVLLMLLCAVVGMFLASPGMVPAVVDPHHDSPQGLSLDRLADAHPKGVLRRVLEMRP